MLPPNIHCQEGPKMSTANILLDKYKQARSLASDNACAGSLGVSRATVSGWRHGVGRPNAAQVDALCAGCGEDSGYWVPLIESERAHSESERRVWRKLADRFARIGATVAGFVLMIGAITQVGALSNGAGKTSGNQGTLYIMSRLRPWSVRVFARLRPLASLTCGES